MDGWGWGWVTAAPIPLHGSDADAHSPNCLPERPLLHDAVAEWGNAVGFDHPAFEVGLVIPEVGEKASAISEEYEDVAAARF